MTAATEHIQQVQQSSSAVVVLPEDTFAVNYINIMSESHSHTLTQQQLQQQWRQHQQQKRKALHQQSTMSRSPRTAQPHNRSGVQLHSNGAA
jgi:hypothetical protein